jgi:hypothetical protein
MSQNTSALLVAEIDELLAAGPVGLYEFMWILRGAKKPGTVAEWKATARQALDTLLAEGRRLVRMHWPEREEFPLPADYQVRDEDFDDIPEDGWYVAITSKV